MASIHTCVDLAWANSEKTSTTEVHTVYKAVLGPKGPLNVSSKLGAVV